MLPALARSGRQASLGSVGRKAIRKRLEYLQRDLRRAADERAEVGVPDHECAHGRRRGDGRDARAVRDQRDLPEELAGPPGRELPAVSAHLRLALEENEEFATAVALTRQNLSLGQVDLVRDGRDPRQLGLRKACEQRHLPDELDLLVPAEAERHGLSVRIYPAAITPPRCRSRLPPLQ